MPVIISNGPNRFHLIHAAEEAYKRGNLTLCIIGAYPLSYIQRLLDALGVSTHRKIARFIDRESDLPQALIKPLFLHEIVLKIGVFLNGFENKPCKWAGTIMMLGALKLYGRMATGIIKRSGGDAKIYHYRAGFGGPSVREAKKMGMITICDHSIAHPELLDYFMDNGGKWPEKGWRGKPNLYWKHIQHDIELADHVLVNSKFVEDTFKFMGWPTNRVHSLYLGVDDKFLTSVANQRQDAIATSSTSTKILFAGSFEHRKGADTVLDAMPRIDDLQWHLGIAGPVGFGKKKQFSNFIKDPRIDYYGTLSRADLASRMQEADIFIFPSLAEGSARVIFEALACGCYVITTPNSGSIVEDGVHGALIRPDNPEDTEAAIRKAISMPDEVRKIGARNAEIVQQEYTQVEYGNKLDKLYLLLTAERK